jgi:hypothetical protein
MTVDVVVLRLIHAVHVCLFRDLRGYIPHLEVILHVTHRML